MSKTTTHDNTVNEKVFNHALTANETTTKSKIHGNPRGEGRPKYRQR